LRAGTLIEGVLAALAFPLMRAGFGEFRLGDATALALGPRARPRLDPARGSGPLATIIQDMRSRVVCFGIVAVVVLLNSKIAGTKDLSGSGVLPGRREER
jgi:hypothetical protein